MNKALITFAKAPVPGTVKTRLQADMGAEKTVEIYKAFVKEILSTCARLRDIDRYLGCAPSMNHPFLKDVSQRYHMKTFNQRGKSLGEKIFNAFRYCAKKGHSEIVLIGSDSPSMPIHLIRKAFSVLKKKDFVIGPCFDQGLYLIGVTKDNISRIDRNITLDTGKDVSMILEKLHHMNIDFSMLPFWYDVDNINDFRFLKLHLQHMNKKLPL